jgi:hypothetical protein
MGTQNLNLSLPPYNSSNWNGPLNDNFTALDVKAGGTANVALAGADVQLTADQLGNMRINLSGAIGASQINIILPAGIGGTWIFSDNTTSSAGGAIFVRTANYTVNPVLLPKSGSEIIFSDGLNAYSAVSGSEGQYLPLSGGVIDGSLAVNKDLTVTGKSTFKDIVSDTLATFKDVVITGTINLALTTIAVGKFVVGNFTLTGNQVFGVQGESYFNGNLTVGSGNVDIKLGSLSVENNTAANLLGGKTTIPAGATIVVQNGGSLTLEQGSILSTQGVFKPESISTGDIQSTGGISVSGTGGVKTGSGGFLGEGPASFQGAADFKNTALFEKAVTFSDKISATGASFVDPVITSTGFASLHFVSGNLQKSVISANTTNQIGFYNEGDLSKYAYLDISTGKWKASGGIATVVGGREVDLGETLMALHGEIASLKAELTALRGSQP